MCLKGKKRGFWRSYTMNCTSILRGKDTSVGMSMNNKLLTRGLQTSRTALYSTLSKEKRKGN